MMISSALIVFGVVLILLLVTVLKSFGINREYQRAVLFRLGRLGEMKGPGWYWLIPFVDRVVRVDTRIITYQLETQETITRDGVAVRVNAVLWFRAESPIQVVNSVENWMSATVQAAETALRDAIGQSELDQMLKDRAVDQQAHAGTVARGLVEMGRRDRFGRDQGRRHSGANAARDRQGGRSDP